MKEKTFFIIFKVFLLKQIEQFFLEGEGPTLNSEKERYFHKDKYFRNRHRRCAVRKGVLENFAKFKGKHLWQSLFCDRVAGLRPATLLKKKLWHWCFPVNFKKFLRTPFLQRTRLGDCFWTQLNYDVLQDRYSPVALALILFINYSLNTAFLFLRKS